MGSVSRPPPRRRRDLRGRRPARRVVLWIAVTAAAVLVLGVAYQNSDAADADLLSVATAPGVPVTAAPADAVRPLWSIGTRAAQPATVSGGTVILQEFDGVRGLDPDSGAERWHYRRSAATLCDASVADDVVVTVFSTGGRCDEAAAFDAATGTRLWYRSVNLSPDVTLTGTDELSVGWTATGIATFGTTSNGLRWRYDPPTDCTIDDVTAGDVGVAVALDCGSSSTAALLDGFNGRARWEAVLPAGGAQVLSADGVVVVMSTDLAGAVHVFDYDGALSTTVRDGQLVPDPGLERAAAELAGDTVVVWTGSRLFGLPLGTGTIAWQSTATSTPVAPDKDAGTAVLVTDGDAFVEIDPATGATRRRITVDGKGPVSGGVLFPLGPDLVLSTPSGVTLYR